MAELEWGLKSSIRGREDTVDLEAHVWTLEEELSAGERSRMEVEEAVASWDIEQALWASEHVLFGGKRAVGRAVWKVSVSCGSWSTRSLLRRQETKLRTLQMVCMTSFNATTSRFFAQVWAWCACQGVFVNALERYLEKYKAQVSEQQFKTCMTFSARNSAFISWENVRLFVHRRSIVATFLE